MTTPLHLVLKEDSTVITNTSVIPFLQQESK